MNILLGQRTNDIAGHWVTPWMAPARFLWLQRRAPDIIDRTRCFLNVSDWIDYRLCGEQACEPTNASQTCLYDIARNEWSDELIGACSLPRSIFPPLVPGGRMLGRVTPAAAEATGLLAGTPVVVGGGDTQCGVLACGALEPGHTACVGGSFTCIQMALADPLIDARGRTWTNAHIVPGRWLLEAVAGAPGITLRWFRDSFYGAELRGAEAAGRSAYDIMTDEARRSPVGANGVVATVGGRVFDAARVLRWRELSAFVVTDQWGLMMDPDSRRHFVRAILEMHAFAVRANCEQLEQISGQSIARLIVCGGWSSNDLWIQILADCLGRPVEVAATTESTALGAAICAGVGVGAFGSMARGIEALGALRPTVEPASSNQDAYEIAYQRWLAHRRIPEI